MPDKKRSHKHGKKGLKHEKRPSSSFLPKSRSRRDVSKERDSKEQDKDEDSDDNDEEEDEEAQDENKAEVQSPAKAQEQKEQGVQMRYAPYSPQYSGPQQQQQQSHMAPMMVMPMQALIPVYSQMEGVLPGLEALAVSGGCYVKQEFDIVEMFSGFEMNNRYSVLNSIGQRIYLAGENTGCCTRFSFGHNRPFKVNVLDGMGQAVLVIEREQNYALCWWGGRIAGSNVTLTHARTGEEIGSVRQSCNVCSPSYTVVDANQNLLLNIRGPSAGTFCPCVMCCDAKFDVTDSNDNEVGTILKTFQALEMISDVTCFGVKYSEQLPVKVKALILASVICILNAEKKCLECFSINCPSKRDFSFFEGSGGGSRGSGRHRSGDKNSLNLSGCRCTLIWLFITLTFGFFFFYKFYWLPHHPKEGTGYSDDNY